MTCLTRRNGRPGHKDTVRPRPCALRRRSLPDVDLGQSRKHAYPRERTVSHVWRQPPGFMPQASCFGGAIAIRNHRRRLNRGAVFPSSYGVYPFHNPDKAAHPGCRFKLRSLGLDEIVRGLPKRKNNAKYDSQEQKQDRAENLNRFPSNLLNAPFTASIEGDDTPRHRDLLQSRKLDSECALS